MLFGFIRDSAIYFLARIVSALIPIVTLPILTRVLTTGQFGVLDFLITLGTLAQLLIGTAPVGAFNFFYHNNAVEVSRQQLIAAGGLWHALVGGVITVLFALSLPFLSEKILGASIGWSIAIAIAVASAAQQYVSYVVNVLRMQERPLLVVTVQICTTLLASAAGIGWALFAADPFTAYVWGFMAGNMISVGVGLMILPLRVAELGNIQRLRDLWRRYAVFGIPLLPGTIAEYSIGFVDRFLLAGHVTASVFGAYALSARIAGIAQIGVQAVMFAFLPMAMRLINRDDHQESEVWLGLIWRYVGALFLSGSIIVTAVAGKFVAILGGSAYASAVMLVGPLVLARVFYSYTYFTYLGTLKMGRNGLFSIAIVAGVLVNILGALPFITSFGPIASALAKLAGCIVVPAISLYFSNKVWPLKFPLGRIAGQSLVAVAYCLWMLQGHGVLQVVAATFLALLLVCALAWHSGDFEILRKANTPLAEKPSA